MTDLAQIVDGTTTTIQLIGGYKKLVSTGGSGSSASTYSVAVDFDASPNTRYLVDTTSGNVTATLPDPATSTTGELVIKKFDGSANTVTLDGDGHTIDGASTLVLSVAYEWATLVSDGSNWAQIG